MILRFLTKNNTFFFLYYEGKSTKVYIYIHVSRAIQLDNIPIVDGEIDFYIENVGCVLI